MAHRQEDEDSLSGWEDEVEQVTCLFCEKKTEGCRPLFAHMIDTHTFDFEATRVSLGLDFYQTVKMINFIRTQVSVGSTPAAITDKLNSETSWRVDEQYLKPVMEDDSLLFGFDDDDSDAEEGPDACERKVATTSEQQKIAHLSQENTALVNEMGQMREALEQMRHAVVRMNFQDEGEERQSRSKKEKKEKKEKKANRGRGENNEKRANRGRERNEETDEVHSKKETNEHEKQYFGGYSGLDIHEEMLKDRARTCAYRDFMYKNPALFKDKVVLDIGCGTGILSMFAARAGAKQVIGIDAADIIDHAREIVKANKLDHIVTLVKSKVEEATLPVDKVDIIVSEWMGYFLLFESMLPSVLFARDKWLVKGGEGGVYPNKATMMIAGVETNEYQATKIDFWKDVYGFDMSCLQAAGSAVKSTTAEAIDPTSLITKQALIKSLDMLVCKDEELDFFSDFTIAVTKADVLGAFVVWFDCMFDYHCSEPVVLGTGPHDTTTHWYQTLFYLERPLPVMEGDVITGKISASRGGDNHREYDVTLEWSMQRPGQEPTKMVIRTYTV